MTTSAIETNQVHSHQSEADRRSGLGHFLQLVVEAGRPIEGQHAREQLTNQYRSSYRQWEGRALGVGSGAAGGYTLPNALHNQVMQFVQRTAIVRSRAAVIEMEGETVEVPSLYPTSTPTANTPGYTTGGFAPAWSADGILAADSDPQFGNAKLSTCNLLGYFEASRPMVQKGGRIWDVLAQQIFGTAVAWMEDRAFFLGRGGAEPLGLVGAPATVTTTARGSGSAITWANLRAVWAALLPDAKARSVWVGSASAEEAALALTGAPASVLSPGTDGAAFNLLGRPFFTHSALPALNTLGDLGVYDLSHYLVGDRLPLEISVSEEASFRNNRIAFRCVHRVAGMPWPTGPAKLADATTNVSPFVHLGPQ